MFVIVVAFAFGLFLPATKYLISWNTFILQIIFFVSCLKIDFKQIKHSLKNWKLISLASFLMLIGFPFIVWLIVNPLSPNLGLVFFLLAAMPVGMTAPLLAEITGGKQSIAMILAIVTSLLAPLTIPLLTKLLYGASISVDALGMFEQLAEVIFLPFILALIVRKLFSSKIEFTKLKTKPLSTLLLGLLIASAVAKQASQILNPSQNWWSFVVIVISMYAFFIILHLVGYFSFWWEKHEDRSSVSVALTYMNFTLAIFLASEFFPRPEILLPLVLSILPWATLPPVWKWISNDFLKPSKIRKARGA